MTITRRLRTHLALAFLAVIALAGCATPTKQIKEFGAASGAVATVAKKGYAFLDQSTTRRQMYKAALHPEIPLTPDVFESRFKSNLVDRAELLGHLADYATALQQLADHDFKKNIDASAKDLTGSLLDLNNSYSRKFNAEPPVTKDQIAILATLVDTAGYAWAEWRRRAAIRRIVEMADPVVQKSASLLANEFARAIGPVVALQLSNFEFELLKSYNQQVRNDPKIEFQKRVEILHQINAVHQNAAAARGFFAAIGKSAENMGGAHARLKDALQHHKFTSPEFLAEVRELVRGVQAAKEFYASLK